MRTYNDNAVIMLSIWYVMQVTTAFAGLTVEQQNKIKLLEAQRSQVNLNRDMSYGAKQTKINSINDHIERIRKGEDEKPLAKAPLGTTSARPQFFAHKGVVQKTEQPVVDQPVTEAPVEPAVSEVSDSITPMEETVSNEQVSEPVPESSSTDPLPATDASSTGEEPVALEQVSAQASASQQSTSSESSSLATGPAHDLAMKITDVAQPSYGAGLGELQGIITAGSSDISKNQVIALVKLALQPIKTSTQSKRLRSNEQKEALRQMLTAGKTEAEKKNKADRVTYQGTPLSGATLGVAAGSDLGLFKDALNQLEKASLSRSLIADRIKPGIGLLKALNDVYVIVKEGSTDFTKDDVMSFLKAIATVNLETEQEKACAVQILKFALDATALDEKLRPSYMGKPLSDGVLGIGGDRSDLKSWYEKVSKKTLSRSLIVDNFALLGDRYEKAAQYLSQIVKGGSEHYTKNDIMKMLEQAYEPIKNKRLKEQSEKDAALRLFTVAKEIVDEKDTKQRPKYHGEYLGQGINFNSRNIRSWYEAARKYAEQ